MASNILTVSALALWAICVTLWIDSLNGPVKPRPPRVRVPRAVARRRR